MNIKPPASEIFTFVVEGTDIRIIFSRADKKRNNNNSENNESTLQILRDDTIQTVKKKLLMELNRVYPSDVAYEELYLTAYVKATDVDPAQLFRESLPEAHTTLSRDEIMMLCKKYGSNPPRDNKDQYTLSEFVGFFEPTRKLVALGAKYAEHKYPFFIPHPLEPNTLTDNVDLDFSETQLLFQYGDFDKGMVFVNIAQAVLSETHSDQHERILRTFYRSLQYSHGIVNFAQLNEKHNELVERTNAAITEKTERAFNSVQLFHDIYNSRTDEMPWLDRGISSITFSIKTASFPLDSIFKSVHSSKLTPLIKYTPGNRREPIYRIYSERVSPSGQKIAYLHEKKITKLAREMGRAGQVSLYIQCKRPDVALFLHFDRSGQIIVDCEFTDIKVETNATDAIAEELNPILVAVSKDTPGLKLPEFNSLREVDILRMKYVMKCEITNNVALKTIPCLNSILLVETSDMVAGASLRYVRVDNYREMNAQTMFINDNRDDVPTLMTGLMRNFGMSEEEAKMRIVSFFNEHADIRGKILDNPGFLVDMRIPRMESAVVITVDRVTSLKYVDMFNIYFDSILRLSQKPKSTAVTKDHMHQVCSAREKNLIDTVAVVQNLPAKPIAVRPETFNLMEVLGLKDTEQLNPQTEYEPEEDEGVFFDDVEEEDNEIIPPLETPKEPSKVPSIVQSETPKEPSKVPSEEGVITESLETPKETPKEPSKVPSEEGIITESLETPKEPPKEPSKVPSSEGVITESLETPKEPSKVPSSEGVITESLETPKEPSKVPSEEGVITESLETPKETPKEPSKVPSEEGIITESLETPKEPSKVPSEEGIITESLETPKEPSPEEGVITESLETPKEPSKVPSEEGVITESLETPKEPSPEEGVITESLGSFPEITKSEDSGLSMRGGVDDSQEEGVEEGEGDVEVDDNGEDKYQQDPTGMPLKNPNPFLKRLKQRDPRLFLTRDEGKYRAYSTRCQPTERQPVVLTDAEKEKIDRENPGSYKHAIKYGTDKDHQFWYICPRYWCFRTNSSITEEDVKAGKCGRVITDEDIKRGTVPKDAHVYEFKSAKTHLDAKGKYIQHYPGFVMKDDMHPDGHCLPCCFKEWDSGRQGTKKQQCLNPQASATATRPAAAEIRQQLYIMDSYPLPNGRWGFLPNVARMFFGVDYKPLMDKNNVSAIIPGQSVFLRCGVEQVHNQSFLGVFADMYSFVQKTPSISVDEFRELLATAITLDVFVSIHNATLPQTFRDSNRKGRIQLDKYKNTDFYKRLSVSEDKDHRLFFEDAVVAYENFQRYLRDSTNEIDHTYLWDVFCAKLPTIHPDGMNLVMLEILDNDATEKIELVCPTNAHSGNSFDPKKQTVFVLKREEFYEPIYLYKTDGKEIFAQKTFTTASIHPNVKQILNMVGKISGKYCAPLTSLPKVYKFRPAISAQELVSILGTEGTKTAVLNYRNKVVGIHTGKCVVPCYPSSVNGLSIPTKFMDETELFADYETTRDELLRVYGLNAKINCKPAFKVVDEGLVVGILTMTNQFVQVNPPSENVVDDGIETMENPNWNDADKASVKGQDAERVKLSKWIYLESQFYSTFQLIARELLNDPILSDKRDRIIRVESSQQMDYAAKIKEVERVLREVMTPSVEFAEMEDGFLLHLDNIVQCGSNDETPYCVMQDDGTQKTLFPSKHLLSGMENDRVYFGRLADQLVRYSRVKSYVLYPDQSITTRTTDYNLGDNEMLLVHSDITPDFFRRIDSSVITPYVKNTAYDFAQPAMSQHYSRDVVKFEDQYNMANVGVDQTLECVKPGLIPIVGNTRSMWVQSFPKTAREKVFLNSAVCTFHVVITVLQELYNKPVNVADIRKLLWAAYAPHVEQHAARIVSVLKSQGKHTLMEAVEHGRMTLETLIFSESYYLSDLDIWVMAARFNLPIIIFTSTYLKGFKSRIMWLRAGGDAGSRFYFIRSGTTTERNNVGEYHLVVPTMATTGLGEFSEQYKSAVSGENSELADCVMRIDEFLR